MGEAGAKGIANPTGEVKTSSRDVDRCACSSKRSHWYRLAGGDRVGHSWGYGNSGAIVSMVTVRGGLGEDSPPPLATVLVIVCCPSLNAAVGLRVLVSELNRDSTFPPST